MNIDTGNINTNRSDGPKRNESAKGSGTSKAENTTTETEATPSANVSLSSSAQNLSKIEAELKSLPEINQTRVDEVRARIESGQYQPDSANLAQKMLDLE